MKTRTHYAIGQPAEWDRATLSRRFGAPPLNPYSRTYTPERQHIHRDDFRAADREPMSPVAWMLLLAFVAAVCCGTVVLL